MNLNDLFEPIFKKAECRALIPVGTVRDIPTPTAPEPAAKEQEQLALFGDTSPEPRGKRERNGYLYAERPDHRGEIRCLWRPPEPTTPFASAAGEFGNRWAVGPGCLPVPIGRLAWETRVEDHRGCPFIGACVSCDVVVRWSDAEELWLERLHERARRTGDKERDARASWIAEVQLADARNERARHVRDGHDAQRVTTKALRALIPSTMDAGHEATRRSVWMGHAEGDGSSASGVNRLLGKAFLALSP